MAKQTRTVDTFPFVRIPSQSGATAIEVTLITQLGHGAGDRLYTNAAGLQSRHRHFIDALDEPSAKLGGVDLERGDPSSLYSFAVGPEGHPFHRHAGQRMFTAIAGSGGTQLRFSTATPEQVERDPNAFLNALHFINIPPDCLFTVRFGGGTWHQFAPLNPNGRHPTLFALSCHPDEFGGELDENLRHKVAADEASIPALTQVLPRPVIALLEDRLRDGARIPTTYLSLDAPQGTFLRAACNIYRSAAGRLRSKCGLCHTKRGFQSSTGAVAEVIEHDTPPVWSLLRHQFDDAHVDHEDMFTLDLDGDFSGVAASWLLSALLDGFLHNPPRTVGGMMALRNILVKPFGLRTSPLGCPVSSLLTQDAEMTFDGKHPVLGKRVDDGAGRAEVVLGADDKHLSFRSCVGVEIAKDGRAVLTMGTRVSYKNTFGRIYMAIIDRTHRRYIAPAMMRHAVEHVYSHDPRDKTGLARTQ